MEVVGATLIDGDDITGVLLGKELIISATIGKQR